MSGAYRQCLLRKPTATGYLKIATWLPARFAAVGHKLTLKGHHRGPEGWEVAEVWGEGEPPWLPPSRFEKL